MRAGSLGVIASEFLATEVEGERSTSLSDEAGVAEVFACRTSYTSFTRRGETQVGSRDLTFEVEVYEASEAELQLKTSVSLRTEAVAVILDTKDFRLMLVANTNPYEGNDVEEAIFLVRSEVVDDVKHEVILSGSRR